MSGERSFSGLFGSQGSSAPEMPPLVRPTAPSTQNPSPGADDHVSQPIPFERTTEPAPPEVDDVVEWLGETIRQTDSSLLDEWESLQDPDNARRAVVEHAPPPPPRPQSRQDRAFAVMMRNAMFARVQLAARDDLDGLVRLEREAADRVDPPREVVMTRSAWDAALEDYYAEHESVGTGPDARGPTYLVVGEEEQGEPAGAPEGTTARVRRVVQTLADPAGHRDWVVEALVDCDASDAAGELVLAATALRRL